METGKRSPAAWSDLVRRWRASGQSAPAFARQIGVNPRTLLWWQWKLRQMPPPPASPPTFVAVEITDDLPAVATARSFVLHLAGSGHRLEVPVNFDAAALRRLVEALC